MPLTASLLIPLAAGFGGHPAAPCGPGGCAPAPSYPPNVRPVGPVQPLHRTGLNVPCPPFGPPAATLTTKLIAPAGAKVTLFPGGKPGETFPAPVTAGFRPGYLYRYAVTDVPTHPGEVLFPVLEIHGSLAPRPTMNPAAYPAAVVITADDVDKALRGGMVTKVIYLEAPDFAVPAAGRPDDPLEVADGNEADAIMAAKRAGRVVAILRLGGRRPDPKEVELASISGTVLLPGAAALGAPAAPPCFGWTPVPLWDPISGARVPDEECFVDGGDRGPRLGIGPNLQLGGLNPTDVAVEYTQAATRRVTTSNVVCVCVPRFLARRVDVGLGRMHATNAPNAVAQETGRVAVSAAVAPEAVGQREKPAATVALVRPQQQVGLERIAVEAGLTRVAARGSVQGLMVAAAVVEPREIDLPAGLTVTKEVDPKGMLQIGDAVTFTIRYRNGTGQPLDDLVVSDSLSGRLEYVPGSGSSDRPANVTASPNEAGSQVVRFELPGTLPPGGSGVVTFRAKIR